MVVVNITINTRRQYSIPYTLITGGQCGGGGQKKYNKHPFRKLFAAAGFEALTGSTYYNWINFICSKPMNQKQISTLWAFVCSFSLIFCRHTIFIIINIMVHEYDAKVCGESVERVGLKNCVKSALK